MVCPGCEAKGDTGNRPLYRLIPRRPKPRERDGKSLGRMERLKEYIGVCPTCGNVVMSCEDRFCNHCGQALDWPEWEDDPWYGWEA